MRWRGLHAPLPLLGKELLEQAARRRTYILRVVCAALLFVFFLVFLHAHLRSATIPTFFVAQAGKGRELFAVLVWILFVGILMFLPAMMSGALTSEKERRSMSLLLLTDLRPREILLQKYLGRLIPMLAILLLALPLLAVCYAYGGMTSEYLLAGVYMLAVTALQAGALALLCSAWCRTSLGAFISAYVATAAFYLLPPLLVELSDWGGSITDPGVLATTFMPELIFLRLEMWATVVVGPGTGAAGGGPTFGALVEQSVGVLASTAAFLLLARVLLLRRAFLTPRDALLLAFGYVDRFFGAVNKAFGDIQVVRDKASLPEDEPIAWREVTKRSLGKARYLFRIFVLLEVPALFLCLSLAIRGSSLYETTWWLTLVQWAVWILAALTVTVVSANAVVAERMNQTLEVLATTPLAGRDILRQKMRGVRRLVVVLAIPLATLHLFNTWWQEASEYSYGYEEMGRGAYLVASALAIAVYLPMLSWFALWISLRSRTRFRAIVRALVTLVAWAVGPWLVFILFDIAGGWGSLEQRDIGIVLLASPATVLLASEYGGFDDLFHSSPATAILVNYGAYGFLLWLFRSICLRRADRYLGRARPPEAWQPPVPELRGSGG